MGQDVSLSAVSVASLPEEDEGHFGEVFGGCVEVSAPRVLGHHCILSIQIVSLVPIERDAC